MGPGKVENSGENFGRSRSWRELREPTSEQLRRSFSFSQRKQRKDPVEPKNGKRNESVKTEESTLDWVGPEKESELISPSWSTVTGAPAHAQEPADATQNTHLQPPPAVPIQRSDYPFPALCLPNPLEKSSCLSNCDNIPPVATDCPSLSATIEAQRLKRQRKRGSKLQQKMVAL